MKLYSWNVNGIRAVLKKGEWQNFLEREQPDIVCLQETKAAEEQVGTLADGYHQHFYSATKKGYAGTAILSRKPAARYVDGFPRDIIEKYPGLSDEYGDTASEGRIIAADFEAFWVVTVYTPNSKGDLSRLGLRHDAWDPAFREYMMQLSHEKPVLFCGDLNVAHQPIDLANPAANRGKHGFTNEERAGFSAFLEAGFVDTFRAAYPDKTEAYSWWAHWANARARNVGWRIDYWLASAEIAPLVKNPRIHAQQFGSDHCPVSIEIDEKEL